MSATRKLANQNSAKAYEYSIQNTPVVIPAALPDVIDGEPLIITSGLIRFHFRLEVLPVYSTESMHLDRSSILG